MKQDFDDLTDLVEIVQDTKVAEPTAESEKREVENAQGEKITLDEKLRPLTF